MVRRKVEIRRIENNSSRQVTFSKRRNGLFKKARDLSVLCEADVAAIIFSARGRLYDFSTPQSFSKIIEQYRDCVEVRNISKKICEAENDNSRSASIHKYADLLQMINRNVEEPHIGKLGVTELVQLEKQLDVVLAETKSRQMQLLLESMSSLQDREKMLQEEKELLQKEIEALKKDGHAPDPEQERNQNNNVVLNHPHRQTTLSLLHW